jgi:uncharacterized protein (TIGR02569 family)
MRPPAHVLHAFGAGGTGIPLAGGRGNAWRFDDVILKPLDVLPGELEWLRQFAADATEPRDLRLSTPLASDSGQLVVDGWTAFPRLEGVHRPGMWHEIAAVARVIAEHFADVERPAFLDLRTHAWARADRLAWGEEPDVGAAGAPFLAELLAARSAVTDPAGIIHGDLAGNVLFDDSGVPAVIDFTAYWRPVQYSIAIVAVDATCFERAPLSLLQTIDSSEQFAQHLVRALIFRIATDWFNQLDDAHFAVYEGVVARVLELARPQGSRGSPQRFTARSSVRRSGT